MDNSVPATTIFYGSAIYDSQVEASSANDDTQRMDVVEERIVCCSCKSQCCVPKQPGHVHGCECKGAGVLCTDNCKCGSKSKPCKNKGNDEADEVDNRNIVSVEESQPIRDLLGDLTSEELLEATARAFEHDRKKLMDLIKDIRSSDAHAATQQEVINAPDYCKCGGCRVMPTRSENKCCKQTICRSKTATFENICLDRENVQTAIRNLSDCFVFTPIYENNAMRHAAYRQYIMWQHGHVGDRTRIVIPSCCVWAIRNAYPSPDNKYTGFIPSRGLSIN